MFGLWSIAAFAQPRDVVYRVAPEHKGEEIHCTARLAVAADGTVAVEKISGCKAHRELVSAALVQWRYEPAPQSTVEEVEILRSPSHPAIQIWSAPRWSSPEEEAEGRRCIAHVWGGSSDRADSIEVFNCDGPAKETLIDTIVSWRFDRSDEPWDRFYNAHQEDVQRRAFPSYPSSAIGDARCVLIVEITAGLPEIEEVLSCGEPFARAASRALEGWRWSKDSPPFASAVTIQFQKR